MISQGRISEIAGAYIARLQAALPELHDAEEGRRRAHQRLAVAIDDASPDALFSLRAEYRGARFRTERSLCIVAETAEFAGRLLGQISTPEQAEKSAVIQIQFRYSDAVASWTDADGLDKAERLVSALPADLSLLCKSKIAELVRGQFVRLGIDRTDRAAALLRTLDVATARKEIETLRGLYSQAATATAEVRRRLDAESQTLDIVNKTIAERATAATMTAV